MGGDFLARQFALWMVCILAAGVLSGCAGGTSDVEQRLAESQAQLAELETQVQRLQAGQAESAQQVAPGERALGSPAGATLVVKPSIFKFPERRLSTKGDVWFSGSGLEPGQRFTPTIEAFGVEGVVVPLPGDMRQASGEGTFAVGTPGIRPGRFLDPDIELRGGAFLVKLWDTETETLLATTPWLVCGQSRENAWCEAAAETALVPEPVVEGAGTVYKLDRFQVEDNLFQLRIGGTSYWGYDVESRINATEGDGIVMTIKLGDTLKFDRLGTSSSRTTVDHRLTIEGLGIDLEIGPGFRLEPWELKPDKAGEFVIDDSSDPGAHGKVLLIVTEE